MNADAALCGAQLAVMSPDGSDDSLVNASIDRKGRREGCEDESTALHLDEMVRVW